jgi:hypothetical protein
MHMIAGLIAEDVYAAMAEPDQLASSRRATTQNDTRRPDRRIGFPISSVAILLDNSEECRFWARP